MFNDSDVMFTVNTLCIPCKLKILHFLVTVYLRKAKNYYHPLSYNRLVFVT
jgi:hypothetical protein